MFCFKNFCSVAFLSFTGEYIPKYTFLGCLEFPDYVKFLFIQTIKSNRDNSLLELNAGICTIQTSQPLQHSLELHQWMVSDKETKKLLIRRNSRLALKWFDFKVQINAGNTWQKWKSSATAGGLFYFKEQFGNFPGKHQLGNSVSVNVKIIRRAELEKGTFERLVPNLRVFQSLLLVRFSLNVSHKALILILPSSE